MSKQLFIPETIQVGFQERNDTYTKKLAYVIYYDQKGVLRKEKSWEGWRNKSIDAVKFQNEPTEGFVLNKGVGGTRHSYGWNARNEYIRVYDPRDFEFEISVANLLFILRECDCSKGKGLEGKFVYAWDGTELLLLPVISTDYQESRKFTTLQAQKVSTKELIPGASYMNKKQKTWVYLGRFDYFIPAGRQDQSCVAKKHIFWTGTGFQIESGATAIGGLVSDAIHPEYANLVERYNKSEFGSRVVDLYLKESGPGVNNYKGYWYVKDGDAFIQCRTTNYYGYSYNSPRNEFVETSRKIYLKDGNFVSESKHSEHYRNLSDRRAWASVPASPWIEPTQLRLFARLESGAEFRVIDNRLERN